jgi:hypothetical protein
MRLKMKTTRKKKWKMMKMRNKYESREVGKQDTASDRTRE